jgi:hypothetical protein
VIAAVAVSTERLRIAADTVTDNRDFNPVPLPVVFFVEDMHRMAARLFPAAHLL